MPNNNCPSLEYIVRLAEQADWRSLTLNDLERVVTNGTNVGLSAGGLLMARRALQARRLTLCADRFRSE
jgi:hypothetical protein